MRLHRPLVAAALAAALTALPVVSLPALADDTGQPETAVAEVPLDAGEEEVSAVTETATTVTYTVSAEDGASMVGVTWDGDSSGGDAQVRTREDDGAWGAWTSLPLNDAAPDAGTAEAAQARTGTEPLWVDDADEVQVRLADADADGAALSLVQTEAVAADGAARGPAATASAAVLPQPGILPRSAWGADESKRRCGATYDSRIKAAVVHHTADANNDYAAADVPRLIRSMYAYHVDSQHWCDLGYNFLVDRFGRTWEGRAGGVDRAVQGAHTGGFNSMTVGVSMIGDYSTRVPSDAMVEAVSQVIAWKMSKYDLDPRAATQLTAGAAPGTTSRYAGGTVVTLPTIFGHRDVGATACPGNAGYAKLGTIRARVLALQLNGQHAVTGGIGLEWRAGGSQNGPLGYPVWSAVCGIAQGGCGQDFQRGSIFWTPATGARSVYGGIAERWNTTGRESGSLRYPVVNAVCGIAQGGCGQDFQKGSIFWTPATGAHAISGVLLSAWNASGRETGTLGYPTGSTVCGLAQGGCAQDFQKGSVFWTPATGARTISGAVLAKWNATGRERGSLGYPTGSTVCGIAQGGCAQDFQKGSIFSTSTTGAHSITGDVLARWNATGRETGSLGYPTWDTVCGIAQGGCAQDFQKGSIFSTPTTGARSITGDVLARWNATGRETGSLGYPLREAVCGIAQGGCGQDFQKGSIFWTAATGAHALTGDLLTQWNAAGRESGALGYPVEEPTGTSGSPSQRFQHGTLTSR